MMEEKYYASVMNNSLMLVVSTFFDRIFFRNKIMKRRWFK